MTTVESVAAPEEGVWRVARAPDPLAPSPPLAADDLSNPNTGNRFDSPLANYRVLYFSTTLEGCFGETLARFRPDIDLIAVIGREWQSLGFMGIGEVPADWRQRRLAVRVRFPSEPTRFPGGIRFLDVDSGRTRAVLRGELAETLAYFRYPDLDSAVVHSHDRRITRYIGQWAYDARDKDGRPVYAGIHYTSRLDPQCWAVFHDVSLTEISVHPVLAQDEALRRVAQRYDLRVY